MQRYLKAGMKIASNRMWRLINRNLLFNLIHTRQRSAVALVLNEGLM
jgi:hypothetical protein